MRGTVSAGDGFPRAAGWETSVGSLKTTGTAWPVCDSVAPRKGEARCADLSDPFTQTGTAASLSRLFAKEAGKRGFAAKAVDMAEFKAAQWRDVSHLLVVTSAYGDGEPPDAARALHAELHSDSAPRLDHREFAVLGLGDTNNGHALQGAAR